MILVKTLMSTFFNENVSPLNTDYISPDILVGILKISQKIQSYISILGILIKTFNLLQNSINR